MEGGYKKMATIKETAQLYEAPQSKNIADLDKVSIELEINKGRAKDNTGEEFSYHFVEVEGERYRIPGSVLGGLKAILKKMPQMKYFSVLREGTGMNTRYQVLPYYEAGKEGFI